MTVRLVLPIVLAVLGLASHSAVAVACDALIEGSSAWAGCVAAKSLEAADVQLNATYRKLVTAMSKSDWRDTKKDLLDSQRAWLVYRNKECAFVQKLSGGASKAPGLECEIDITKERISYLNRVLEGLE